MCTAIGRFFTGQFVKGNAIFCSLDHRLGVGFCGGHDVAHLVLLRIRQQVGLAFVLGTQHVVSDRGLASLFDQQRVNQQGVLLHLPLQLERGLFVHVLLFGFLNQHFARDQLALQSGAQFRRVLGAL